MGSANIPDAAKKYVFMRRSYLHLTVKRHLMIFKHEKEVIDTLARKPSDFLAIKNVCTSYRSKRPLFKNNSWVQLHFVDEKAKVDAAYRQSSSSQTR